MRIQSVSQNNYQNRTPKKEIGFKNNVNLNFPGLHCSVHDLCGPSINTLLNVVSWVLIKTGNLRPDEEFRLIEKSKVLKGATGFAVIDSASLAQIDSAQSFLNILNETALLAPSYTIPIEKIFPNLGSKISVTRH